MLAPSPPQSGPASVRNRAILALLAATFVISVTFGLNMPLLPPLIAAVSRGDREVSGPLHAGLLAAVFTFALGAAAPAWGAWSDRVGRRPVLVLGMAGFAASMLIFSRPSTLASLYAEQLFSGISAAAVMPVSSALVADLAPDDHWRASRLAWLNMALVAGFILGPVAGSLAERLLLTSASGAVLVVPFLATAIVAAPVVAMLWRSVPRSRAGPTRLAMRRRALVTPLLGLTFAVSLAIGVFEVAIAVRGGGTLRLSPARVAALFTSCSVVMFLAQAVVFSPWVKPRRTAALLAPAFVGLAVGLAGAGFAGGFGPYVAAVTLFATSGGVLVPVLAYWVSRNAGGAQGAQLGRQTAAAGLGQAAGSGLAGLVFASAAPPGAALWVGAGLAGAAAVLAWRIARRMAVRA